MCEHTEAEKAEIDRLRRGRFGWDPVTLIADKYDIRCWRCRILLGGAPILAIPTEKGYRCAEREVCAWRRLRNFQKRQLFLPFGEGCCGVSWISSKVEDDAL
jgi:hypothetical protein